MFIVLERDDTGAHLRAHGTFEDFEQANACAKALRAGEASFVAEGGRDAFMFLVMELEPSWLTAAMWDETCWTTTQYRIDAVPFVTKADAQAAIDEFKPSDPTSAYSVRNYYEEGFYVLIQFPTGGNRWLTQKRNISDAEALRAAAITYKRAVEAVYSKGKKG